VDVFDGRIRLAQVEAQWVALPHSAQLHPHQTGSA